MKEWIDINFDNNITFNKSDQSLGEYISKYTGQSVYYLILNPTAKNIALHLREDVIPQLFAQCLFQILKIRLYETPNCHVECSLDKLENAIEIKPYLIENKLAFSKII